MSSPRAEETLSRDGDGAAHLGLVLAAMCWASAFVGSKYVLRELTPLAAAGIRFILAGLLLVPSARRAWPAGGVAPLAWPMTRLVLLGGVAYPWLFFEAIARTTATKTALLVALNPTLTWLLSPLVGERLAPHRLLALLIALGGAWTMITHGDVAQLRGLGSATGDLLALAAALVWAVYNLATRPVMARVAPSVANCFTYGAGGVVLALLATPSHPLAQLAAASPSTFAALGFLALVPSVIAAQLFLGGVQRLGVTRAVPYINLVPLGAALLSAILLGERPGTAEVWGGMAVLAGVALGSWDPGRMGNPLPRRRY